MQQQRSPYLMTFSVASAAVKSYLGVINNDDTRGNQPVAQHFLKSKKARTLSVKEVMRMSEDEAFATFAMLRWPDTEGEATCPHCGHDKCYMIKTRRRFKCAACRKQFSITSGTIFHSAKLELRDYLAVIALFVNAVKGISALQICRDVGISYKAAFVLLHKLREAIDGTRADITLSGEVEIDGAYYGGHVRPSNGGREGRKPSQKRRKKCVLTLVQRGGPTVTKVIPSENTDDILEIARKHIAQDSVVFADEHGAYDALHARYQVFRINHRWSYSDGIACTNQAESFHSRMRRAEKGQYHRVSDRYLDRYASEIAYRSDRRRVDNGTAFSEVTEMAIATPASRNWIGYWQKRAA